MRHKKASFDSINNLMIAFLGFFLICTLAIFFVSTIKHQPTLVCSDPDRATDYRNDSCYMCATPVNGTVKTWVFNTTGLACCNNSVNSCFGINTSAAKEYNGSAWEGIKYMSDASMLPPQFASIIVIVVIIVGILAILATIGYVGYKRLKE